MIAASRAQVGAARWSTYDGRDGPLRHNWSPSMSLQDDEFRPDLQKTGGKDGLGPPEQRAGKIALSRYGLLTGLLGAASFAGDLRLELFLDGQPDLKDLADS